MDQIHIDKVTLVSEDGNTETVVKPGKTLPIGQKSSFGVIGLAQTGTRNKVGSKVNYDIGGLNNLVAEGTITGNIELNTEKAEPGNGEWVFVDVSKTPDRYMDTSGMSDFYLMKYEARNSGGTPVSKPGVSIYRNINQTQAMKKCRSIGASLVSGRQWMAVAHQAAVNPDNWADGVVGSTISSGGGLYSGNTGNSNSVSYNGPNPDPSQSNATKRTLELANGEKVWDLSGNVWEWTSNSFKTLNGKYQSPRVNGNPGNEAWNELNEITSWNGMPSSSGTNSTWNADQGIGRIYLNGDQTYGEGSLGNGEYYNVSAVQRGGHWGDGRDAGVFSALLHNAPSNTRWTIGFRCAKTP
ncbi:MAG: hypothetical protein ABEJ95_07185 [Candidatus Nanohalobium sp.]